MFECLLINAVLMQVPSNLLVSKIRYPAIYICSAVAVWGAISACTAAVNSFGSLVACRFMLGFVEAVFFPGAFYYLHSKADCLSHCCPVLRFAARERFRNASGNWYHATRWHAWPRRLAMVVPDRRYTYCRLSDRVRVLSPEFSTESQVAH